jgi:site-specific DNA-methyltransferase (adenine-specific)
MIKITNEDNMQLMARYEDNHFDLAIVDPPYGIARFGNRVELSNRLCKTAKLNEWDVKPNKEYFSELFRVSKKQIIWGANNFTLPESEYFLIWDKKQTVDNFASAEYAWTNCKKPAQVFRYSIHKTMSDRKAEGGKIHPTQKPIRLYEWLLLNYAKEGNKILDTHGGSLSIALAVHNVNTQNKMNLTLDVCELDKDYYLAGKERLRKHQQQLTIF